MSRTKWLVFTFGGLGGLPRFPGTWGTLGAALLYLAARLLIPWDAVLFWGTGAAALVVAAASVPLGRSAQEAFGEKDPRQFVLDEVAGFFVSIMLLGSYSVGVGVAAFVFFRILDIFKPWPIRKLETVAGGWGILLDDLAAGLAANALVRWAAFLLPFI